LNHEQVIIIGAGPCGLSAAIALQNIGIQPLVIEKEMLAHSIYQYPTYMYFFSTSELLEVGGVPFTTPNEKPSRVEALNYYRQVAKQHQIRIHAYEEVLSVHPTHPGFELQSITRFGESRSYSAERVIIATGYFDNPNHLGIPGEDLSKVSHFFREAHPYMGMNVAIIGGNNSAIDAALELLRVDAKITVVYRKHQYSPTIKPWVLPIFQSAVEKGRIQMIFDSQVIRITQTAIEVRHNSNQQTVALPNDFVLALTGFRPDRDFLNAIGVTMDKDSDKPMFDPATMETNVNGLYVAGVIASGRDANEVFIETGRFHGRLIAEHILTQR
jgi:thioredoxin reductase (NADPH)